MLVQMCLCACLQRATSSDVVQILFNIHTQYTHAESRQPQPPTFASPKTIYVSDAGLL